MSRQIIRLFGGLSLAALICAAPMGCVGGANPDVSDFCAAFKRCTCKATYGTAATACDQGVEKQIEDKTKTDANRSRDEHCQELFEKSPCYKPLPVGGAGATKFRGTCNGKDEDCHGKDMAAAPIGDGWVRGKCAKAALCCLHHKSSYHRARCLQEIELAANTPDDPSTATVNETENKCAEAAGKDHGNGLSCPPTVTWGAGGGPGPGPGPGPSPDAGP